MKKKLNNLSEDFLYHQISDIIAAQIQRFTLKTGDKLPSLRAFSVEQGISLSTAYKAYSELEMIGLIEARPKSGYFVRYTPVKSMRTLKLTSRPTVNRDSNPDELLVMVQQNFTQEGLIKLSLATPDISLLPQAKLNKSMIEAIRSSASSCMLYEDVQGYVELRKHIARQAINWGGNVSFDDIVTTQGCSEALIFSMKAITKPGDVIAIESPSYFGMFNAIKSLGLNAIEIVSHPSYGIDLGSLELVLSEHKIAACIFVTSFSNPSGHCMSNENKKKMVKLLLKHNVPLIEDDIYGEIYFGKARPKTCKSFDKNGMVVLCSSFSKSLAPGYRVGWCIPGKFKDDIIKLKLISTVSSATPNQHAIANLFETGRYDLHMRNLRKALYEQCLRYIQAIIEYFPSFTKVNEPGGGYVLWIELPESVNAFDVYLEAFERHIGIAPGQLFSMDRSYTNYIRIGYGLPYTKAIDKGLRLLGNIIRELAIYDGKKIG